MAQNNFKLKIENLKTFFFLDEGILKAVNNVDIILYPGESIGIIGESGAGKTTLVDVLLGFLDPDEGIVSLDGISINKDLRHWLDRVAYIPQSIVLLDDTLRKNVALGTDENQIDDYQVLEAIDMAQLQDVVRELPEGINTVLGEGGVRLSGGQRQRVALACAFYHQREAIIMDEATSALDHETEKEVVRSIQSLKGKKTLIVIAHRHTTVQHCDVIYQLNQGKIIKSGSYNEVISPV